MHLHYSAWGVALPRPLLFPIFEKDRDTQVDATLGSRTLLLRTSGWSFQESSIPYRVFIPVMILYIRSAAVRDTTLVTPLVTGTAFPRGLQLLFLCRTAGRYALSAVVPGPRCVLSCSWGFSKNKQPTLDSIDTELIITEMEQVPVPGHGLKQ
jgi:hypothetical protein